MSAALSEKMDRDRKLGHLLAVIADYEAEFGEITAEEMLAQARADSLDSLGAAGSSPADQQTCG